MFDYCHLSLLLLSLFQSYVHCIFVSQVFEWKQLSWVVFFHSSALKLNTFSQSNKLYVTHVQEVLKARENSKKPHIWNFRTRYEASQNWQKMYGHLDKPEWGKSFCTNELLLPYNFTGGLEKETFRDQIKFIPNWRYQKARFSFLFSAKPSHWILNWEDLAY